MEPSRAEAKGAIITRESDDPDLNNALSEATRFQLDLVKETNRHKENMRGTVAKLFGNDGNVPVYVAAVGMVLGLAICCGLWIVAGQKSQAEAGPWMQQAERLLAFCASCLAFIFGKGLSKD